VSFGGISDVWLYDYEDGAYTFGSGTQFADRFLTETITILKTSSDTTSLSLVESVSGTAVVLSSSDNATLSIADNGYASAVTETASLRAMVDTIYAASLETGGEGYVVPTSQNLTDLQSAWVNIKAGNLAAARNVAETYNFDVVVFLDSDNANKEYRILRERINPATNKVYRGWGYYIWNISPVASKMIIEAPHLKHDLFTQLQGVNILIGDNAQAFLANTSHRDANAQLVGNDSVADVANITDPPSSIYQYIHQATDNTVDNFIFQPHGFATGGIQKYDSALYRARTFANTNDLAVTGITVATPPVQAGDYMFAFLSVRDSTNVITDPTGWTRVQAAGTRADFSLNDGTLLQSILYQRVATASEPVDYTWNWSIAAKAVIGIVSYRDSAGIDVAAAGIESGTTTIHTTPSITTTVPNTGLVSFMSGASSSSWTSSVPGEWVERVDDRATPAGGTSPVSLSIQEDTFAHDIGTYSVTHTSSLSHATGVYFILAMKPSKTPVDADIVLSNGTFPPSPTLYKLGQALRDAGYVTHVNENHTKWTATGNVQGAWTRGNGTSEFVHMEHSTRVRSDAVLRNGIDNVIMAFNISPDKPVATETITIGITESASVVPISAGPTLVASSDNASISVSETAESYVTLSSQDPVGLSITETVQIKANTVASDATSISITDTTGTFVSVQGIDTTSLSVIESASVFVIIKVVDSTSLSTVESVNTFVYLMANDSSVISATESFANAATVFSSESVSLSVTETSSIGTVSVSASDNSTLFIGEANTLIAAAIVNETNSLSIAESSETRVSLSAADTTSLSTLDTSTTFLSINGAESSSLSITETSSNHVIFSRTDTSTLSLAESVAIFVTLQASDSGSVSIAETTTVLAHVTASDNASLSVTENVQTRANTSASDTTTISIADMSYTYVPIQVFDTTSVSLSESSNVFVYISVSDPVSLSVTESTANFVYLAANDSTLIAATEGSSDTATVLASDITSLSVIDTSSVLVSGEISLSASESGSLAITELTFVLALPKAFDSGSLSTTETSSVVISGEIVKSGAETSTVAFGETNTLRATVVASELNSLTVTETSAIDISGIVVKSAADGSTISTTESAIIQTVFSANDVTSLSITDVSSIVASGEQSIFATDSSNLITTETTSLALGIFGAESVLISTVESNAIRSSFQASETTTLTLTESTVQKINNNAIDTASISVSETTLVNIPFTASDSGSLAIAETSSIVATGNISVIGSDSSSLSTAETVQVFVGVAVTDNASLTLTESGLNFVSMTRSDATSLSVTDTAQTRLYPEASDTGTISITESSTIVAKLSAQDNAAVSVTDSASTFVYVNASERATVSIAENFEVYVKRESNDTGTLSIVELSVIEFLGRIEKSATDIILLSMGENAPTNVYLSADDTVNFAINDLSEMAIEYRLSTNDSATLVISDIIVENNKQSSIQIVGNDLVTLNLIESKFIQVSDPARPVFETSTTSAVVSDSRVNSGIVVSYTLKSKKIFETGRQ